MTDFSQMTVCVMDHGLYPHVAIKLAESFGTVLYWIDWTHSGFPSEKRRQIGTGIPGIRKVDQLWKAARTADLVVATDVYFHDEIAQLREMGKPVWGAGYAEALEVERWKVRQLMDEIGMDVIPYEVLIGEDALKEYLADKDDAWIKTSVTRGDFETMHWQGEHLSGPDLEKRLASIGPRAKTKEFIVEPPVPGCEFGYDGFCVDGRFSRIACYGAEDKDAGYIGKVCRFSDMPLPVRIPTVQFAPLLRQLGCRGFYSNEMRIAEDGTSYLIDPCLRCYSDDTEILTDKGWKFFKDLDRTETVATLNPDTNEIEYHRPYAYQTFDYSGEMVHFRSRKRKIDLLVTPDHSMWARARSVGPLRSFRAGEMTSRYSIPAVGKWVGEEPEYFELPAYANQWANEAAHGGLLERSVERAAVRIPITTWLAFLGFYLSEGSAGSKWHISIRQDTTRKRLEMLRALADFPFEIKDTGVSLQVGGVQLVAYLKQFGLAHEKHVPEFVKRLSPRLIEIFLEAYALGDGTYHRGQRIIATASRQMADDLQELVFKAGKVAWIKTLQPKGSTFTIDGRTYTRNHDVYGVIERAHMTSCYVEGSNNARCGGVKAATWTEREPYNGKVYDLTVQNHIIYVRRNGIPIWSGNCGSPPSESYIELFSNWAEVIWAGAHGEVVDLVPAAKYAAQIVLRSGWVEDDYLPVYFPEEIARWVKLHNYCILDGKVTVMPQGFGEFGSAIGLGDTKEEAEAAAREHAEQIEALELEWKHDVFDSLDKAIEKGREVGVNFD